MSDVTLDEYRQLVSRRKYGNRKTTIDGITFDSKREAARYRQLKALEQAGEICNLELQPRFVLLDTFTDSHGKRHQAITYVADFQYTEAGRVVVEDAKGVETAVFKIKRKLFLSRYPHELRIV